MQFHFVRVKYVLFWCYSARNFVYLLFIYIKYILLLLLLQKNKKFQIGVLEKISEKNNLNNIYSDWEYYCVCVRTTLLFIRFRIFVMISNVFSGFFSRFVISWCTFFSLYKFFYYLKKYLSVNENMKKKYK